MKGADGMTIVSSRPSLNKQIVNVKKSVKKIQNREELKNLDTLLNGTAINSTATFTLLNGMVLGDTSITREGDEIHCTSIQFRNIYNMVATNLNADINVRHIVFWDRQANGAAPAITQLLDTSVITLAILAPYNRDFQERFKIVYDKTFRVFANLADPANAATEVVSSRVHKKAKKSLSRTTKYIAGQNAGTVADIASNSLFSCLVTDNGTANITVQGGFRLYFKDN